MGNKRSFLVSIEEILKTILKELNKEKLDVFDAFSGSGIVSRFLKRYSTNLYTNDLENYCETLNKCYLKNENEIDLNQLDMYYDEISQKLENEPLFDNGFIYKLYAPHDDKNIKENDRVFYTSRNAKYLDTARQYIEKVPEPYKSLLLGPLLYEASTKNNTAGIFKGFYKNSDTKTGQFGGNGKYALNRITSDIKIKKPVLSKFNTNVHVFKGDANEICKQIPKIDLAYIDPPYNQHPYGSNYFMLNLINDYIEPSPSKISKVSGIPQNWNKSKYNTKSSALKQMEKLCKDTKASYLLISYNSEGFIQIDELEKILKKIGDVKIKSFNYITYRGSRNLKNRKPYVEEYLILVHKKEIL
ncbi:DNA adenine methylase [Mycoplasmopsis equigenitalium]|uniref:site-specific DNA-methyltransferase (adenine-specific) n=1 Tax=Mycoplasmopsis equigenitalium TaxID=114883 RepID=A0ABY5J238_9BACT|nr:DNA adenine methylase [Mycoplasmopsis equigenitalium]